MTKQHKEGAEEIPNKPEPGKKNQRTDSKRAFTMGIVVAIVAILILVTVFVTAKNPKAIMESRIGGGFLSAVGFPAASINGDKIPFADYLADKQALMRFYDSQTALPSIDEEEIERQVLSRLLLNALVRDIADQYDVVVDSTRVDELQQALFDQYESDEAAIVEITENYGWDLETYRSKVLAPIVLEQATQEAFELAADTEGDTALVEEVNASHILFQAEEGESPESVKRRAEQILRRLERGEDFATLAAEYGTDSTKDSGGSLGWFPRGVMIPAFEEVVFSLEPGALAAEPVQTEFGYHIIKVDDRRERPDFASYMRGLLAGAEINTIFYIENPFTELPI